MSDGRIWDRVAAERLDDVVSPFEDAETNPLLTALVGLPRARAQVAADLGCGPGALLSHLTDRFRRVVALDASAEMVERARARMRRSDGTLPPGLTIRRASLLGLAPFAATFDVAIASNSILMPENREVRRALGGVYRSLRPGGLFLGIFPSLESIQAAFRFCHGRARRDGLGHDAAWALVDRRLRGRRINFALGTFDVGYMIQKHFTRVEIEDLLAGAGFTGVELDRVVYPRRLGLRWVDSFGGRPPRVWHWFVRAQRR